MVVLRVFLHGHANVTLAQSDDLLISLAMHASPMLPLKTYAHAMQDEETELSFADFSTGSSPKRPYTAPLLNETPDSENAPDLTGRGRSLLMEHETGLEPATPTLARRCAA